jgi:hypothetical protein
MAAGEMIVGREASEWRQRLWSFAAVDDEWTAVSEEATAR